MNKTDKLNDAWCTYVEAIENVFLFAIAGYDERRMASYRQVREVREDARRALVAAGGTPK